MLVGSPLRLLAIAFLLLLVSLCVHIRAQETGASELDKSPPKGMPPEEIIRRFTTKEKEWKQLREQYSFRQSVKVQAMDGETVRGEYQEVAEISYRNSMRSKKVLLAPQPSIQMSAEDLDDLESRPSFTISTDELPQYNVLYSGQQRVDELHCYVFEVAPKQLEKGRRYFQGRIWVDDQDFQIVKNTGKSVPDLRIVKKKRVEENLFPQFTTWRELIDKHWFPTFSSSDDTLHFRTGDVRLKQVLKFTDYQRTVAGAGKNPK